MSAAPRNDPALATEPVTVPVELATPVSTLASSRMPYAVASAAPAVSESLPLSAATAESTEPRSKTPEAGLSWAVTVSQWPVS